MQESELCQCCHKVPPAYYTRRGVYLPNICLKCYLKHPEDSTAPVRNHSTIGGKAGARS